MQYLQEEELSDLFDPEITIVQSLISLQRQASLMVV